MTPQEIRAKALDLAIQFASVKVREEPTAEVDVMHVARDFEDYIAGPAKPMPTPSTPRIPAEHTVRESDTPTEHVRHIEHGDDVWGPLCVCEHSKGNHKSIGCLILVDVSEHRYCECEGYVKGVAS